MEQGESNGLLQIGVPVDGDIGLLPSAGPLFPLFGEEPFEPGIPRLPEALERRVRCGSLDRVGDVGGHAVEPDRALAVHAGLARRRRDTAVRPGHPHPPGTPGLPGLRCASVPSEQDRPGTE